MLHAPTLLFALVLLDFVLVALLFVAVPRPRKGVSEWSLALFFQALSFASLALRAELPVPVSVFGTNLGAMAGSCLQVAALRSFHGRTTPLAPLVLLPLLTTVVPLALGDALRWRIVFGGVAFGGAQLAVALTEWKLREPHQRPGSRLVLAGAFATSFVLAARGLAAAVRPELFLRFDGEGPVPVASALVGQALTLCTSLGFLLLHRERQESEMERLAMTDALTGVLNRRVWFELGERVLAQARRDGTGVAVMLVDLDHFKRINDTHGHPAGDAVLKRFTEVARGCLRSSDVFARYGGEEFCILLPGASVVVATQVAERLREAVAGASVTFDGKRIDVTASLGLAVVADASSGLDAMLGRADAALYKAKAEGRNRVVVDS